MTSKILALAGASAIAFSGAAHAQVSSAGGQEGSSISEVVVTAMKREQNLQDVPAVVTVVSGERLSEQDITTLGNFKTLAPGFDFRKSSNDLAAITVRGIGTSTASPSFDQSVGSFIDGVFTGHTRQFNGAFFDVERVELLKGTQAALLGKNTSLGGVMITTRKPGPDYGFNVTASHEFELKSDRVEVGFDAPISDTLKLRIAGQYDHRGGWSYNTIAKHWGPDNVDIGGRGTLVWTPTDKVDVTATYQGNQTDRQGNAVELINDWWDIYRGGPFPGGYLGDTVFDFKNDTGVWYGVGKTRYKGRLGVVTANYHLSNGTTLSSLTGYLRGETIINDNAINAYFNVGDQDIRELSEQWSQEFRITSQSGVPLEYIGGIYLSHDLYKSLLNHTAYGPASTGIYSSTNPPPPPGSGINLQRPPVTGIMTDVHNAVTDSASAFGVLTYNFNHQLSLTASGRYTYEDRSVDYWRFVPLGRGVGEVDPTSPATLAGGVCLRQTVTSVTLFLPTCAAAHDGKAGMLSKSMANGYLDGSITATFKPTEDINFYASYGTGTKGANYIVALANKAAAPFDKEVAKSAEIGVKSRFRNLPVGDLRLNLTYFDTKLDGLQVAVFNVASGSGGGSRNVHVRGIDLDFDWYPPVEGLAISGAVEYLDAKNLASPKDPSPVGAGTPASQAPKWAGNLRADYRRQIGENYSVAIQPSMQFRSWMYPREFVRPGANPCNPTATVFTESCQFPKQGGYTQYNLRIALMNDAQDWDLALVGRNITNELITSYCSVSPIGVGMWCTSEPSRTIALQFSLRR